MPSPDSSANPFVFVVGCPRSGTTLLQRMLDDHPMLAVANDTHFIPKAIRGAGRMDVTLTSALVDRVRSYHRFARLGLPARVVERAAEEASTYAGFVRALYDALAAEHGKPLAGEKTPDYVRHLPLLHGLFPEAKFLHIVRDGRDVALSVLGWARVGKGPGRFSLWQHDPVAVCALWWERFVRAGMEHGRPLGPRRYLELRYEALVSRPREAMERVASFLDLPFVEELLTFHEGRSRTRPGLSAKKAWLPPTPGLRDWRIQLPRSDVELFEALAGDVLEELGYERAFAEFSDEAASRAGLSRAWWETERRAAS